MEKTILSVRVDLETVNGRTNVNILTNNDLNKNQIMAALSGGMALLVRSEKTPEEQGRMLSMVVNYLQNELVNIDSFSDAKFFKMEK